MVLSKCEVLGLRNGNFADIGSVYAFFISTNFAIVFFYGSAIPPLGSSFAWKKILKLPVKIICSF